MNLTLPTPNILGSQSGGGFFIFLWAVYLVLYWIALVRILGCRHFEAADRILWFLVITLAPIIGILTYWWIEPASTAPTTKSRPPPSAKDPRISPLRDDEWDRSPSADTKGTPWEHNPGHTLDAEGDDEPKP